MSATKELASGPKTSVHTELKIAGSGDVWRIGEGVEDLVILNGGDNEELEDVALIDPRTRTIHMGVDATDATVGHAIRRAIQISKADAKGDVQDEQAQASAY